MDFSHLIGKTGHEAEQAIKQSIPDAQVQILAEGSPTTRDYRPNRYRVFISGEDKVVSAPRAG